MLSVCNYSYIAKQIIDALVLLQIMKPGGKYRLLSQETYICTMQQFNLNNQQTFSRIPPDATAVALQLGSEFRLAAIFSRLLRFNCKRDLLCVP